MTVSAEGKLRFVLDEVVLPDGRSVGEALANGADPWIVGELLEPAFAVDGEGLPRYALIYPEVARGHWKSGGAAAVALAEAVLEPGTDVIVAASDLDQAGIDLDALDGYLERNERLAPLVTSRQNERLVEGGSRIRCLSSDTASAWGHGGVKPRLRIVCDELTSWRSEELWSAMASSTGKIKNAQIVVLSNAGFDAEKSWQWRIRETARTQEWAHLFSPEGVVASWVTDQWVEQQRALLPALAFERVIENRWTAQQGDFVTAEQWQACVDERLTRSGRGTAGPYFAGLDLGLSKDRTALAVVHRDGDLTVMDELDVWFGTRAQPVSITQVERAVADAAKRYPGLVVFADPWQLKGSIERLRQEHVRISEFVFTASSVQRLSAALFHAITSAALRVPPDPELTREILGMRIVEGAGGWRMDHRAGGYSDRAVALAMALQAAQRAPRGTASYHVARGQIGDTASAGSPRAGRLTAGRIPVYLSLIRDPIGRGSP